jgi:hypothetical protein
MSMGVLKRPLLATEYGSSEIYVYSLFGLITQNKTPRLTGKMYRT